MTTVKKRKDSVLRPLLRLSIPSMVGLLANSLYQLVDGIFIGQFAGKIPLAGVTIAVPLQTSLLAMAFLFGAGSNALYSIASGSRDEHRKKVIVISTLVGSFITILLAIGLVMLFMDPILRVFGGTGEVLEYAKTYMYILTPFFIFQAMAIIYENLLRAAGNSFVPMLALFSGALLNIILCYIFVGILDMSVVGAGISTAISILLSFLIDYIYVKWKKPPINIPIKRSLISIKAYWEVCASGFSAFANQIAFSIRALILNRLVLFAGGDTALVMVGIITRLDSFMIIPVFGLVHGMRPIVGHSYGSKNYSRIKKCLLLVLASSTIYLLIMWTIVLLFSKQIASLFINDPNLIITGGSVIVTVHLGLFLVGFNIVNSTFFQSIKKNGLAFFFSIMNPILIFMPLAFAAAYFGNSVNDIWRVYPITDVITSSITAITFIITMKRLKRELDTKPPTLDS